MKKLIPILFAVFFVNMVFAKPITEKQAVEVAQKYFKYRADNFQSSDIKSVHTNKYNGLTSCYVINFKEGGFVIVSADDRVKPILAYSLKNSAPENVDNAEVNYWLDVYNKQIEYAVINNLNNAVILNEWEGIRNENFSKSEKAVTPLLTTTWDQGGAYNDYCPTGTPTGCVATAMAQIMNYYEFPVTGAKSHAYDHPTYGNQSADFSTGNYDWASMPDGSASDAVAWLMYHCGVAVDMNYGPTGSGAASRDVTYTLANYFKYDQGLDYISIDDYSNSAWISILKNELDYARPVYYSGRSDASGGHAFVFDGYDDSDNFHVNWGWSGIYNGYFAIGSLNPGGSNFNDDNAAIIGIEPSTVENEEFLIVKKYSGLSDEAARISPYIGYMCAVDENVAWGIARDGSGETPTLDYRIYTRTTDGGQTWTANSVTDLGGTAFSMIFGLSDQIAYIAMYGTGTDYNHILRTTNGGTSWESILDASAASFFNVVHFFNTNDGVALGDPEGGEYEFYTTNDGGDTWVRVAGANIPDPNSSGEYGIVGFYTAIADTVWYTTNEGRVYKSTDMGYNWNVYNICTPGTNSQLSIAFDDGGLNGISVNEVADPETLYSTSDAGETWTQITSPSGNFYSTGISSVPGEANTFISVGADVQTQAAGISYTIDAGETWIEFPEYYQNYQFIYVDMLSWDKGFIGTFADEWSDGVFLSYGSHFPDLSANFYVGDMGDTLHCSSGVTFNNNSGGIITSYDWDFGADATPPTAGGIGPHNVVYSTGGEKTVELIISDGTDNDIFTDVIKVSENAPAAIDTIYGATIVITIGSTETYSVDADSELYTFYNWSENGTNWSGNGSTTNEFEVTFGGFDATSDITCYASNGCGDGGSYALSVHYTNGVDIEEINSNVNLFPNPATNNIEIDGIAGNSVLIYDISGKLVYSAIADSDNYIIDISDLAEGFYTVRISDGKEIRTGRFNIVR
ncbi:MAG: C10 family peptidase [Bacteroidales bacterium]|nr:C10 family peptidase [Bacteroidales bacterium]